MSPWITIAFDVVLISLVALGLIQSVRLMRNLSDLRDGRNDMERFVREFNAAVLRADSGIKGLRMAARESGDDLEKLVERASGLRDELHFIIESADQIASRLSAGATTVLRPAAKTPEKQAEKTRPAETAQSSETKPSITQRKQSEPSSGPQSRAEKELMQALGKLG